RDPNKGGTVDLGGVKVTLTHAQHSSSTVDEDHMVYLGEPVGLVFEVENGTKLYFAGDTNVFGDMQLIKRLYAPDVAVLPIGGHYTMDPKEAAVALEFLGVSKCVPCHHGTYPIVACDLEAQQWGVSVQSKFLSVGSVVPWAEPHVGAIATQAYANPRYGPNGLALLREGLSAEQVVDRLTGEDEGRDHRQLGVVDGEGRAATYTGSECMGWAGGGTGDGDGAQGNILISKETGDARAQT